MKTNDALDLTIEDLMTDNVKIMDGIAGAAKTSHVVHLLQANGIPYRHLTSTNKLRRDVATRFAHPSETVASALFTTTDGDFYQGDVDNIEERTIVIDEILQTSGNVIRWIDKHHDRHNIIVCTDSKQMLTPFTGSAMLKQLEKIKDANYVDSYNFSVSHRPVNRETSSFFDSAYSASSEEETLFKNWQFEFDWETVTPERIPDYNANDAFLCHSNDIESILYRNWGLSSRYDLDLIPKGTIANKQVKDVHKYPILPQNQAGRQAGYFQVSNVGSVVRYQGTEVQPGAKLFYLIGSDSISVNREVYTMLTRAKDIASVKFLFVEMDGERDVTMVSFQGLPIIKQAVLVKDGYKPTSKKEYQATLREANDSTPDKFYIDIVSNGHRLSKDFPGPTIQKAKVNAWAVARKMPYLGLSTPGLFWSTIDHTGYRGPVGIVTSIDSPDAPQRSVLPYTYGIDLISAYPHVWNIYGLPDGRTYRTTSGGAVDLWLVTSGRQPRAGSIITGDLYSRVKNIPGEEFAYIGSIDRLRPDEDKIGPQLLAMTKQDKESKADVKKMQWGWFQRDYLEPSKYQKGKPTAYVIYPDHVYLLVMVFISSALASIIMDIKAAILGTSTGGRSLVDCVYFSRLSPIATELPTGVDSFEAELRAMGINTPAAKSEIIEIADKVRSAIPAGYDFRIFQQLQAGKTSEQPVLYSTQEELPTAADRKKKQHREHMREVRRNAKN